MLRYHNQGQTISIDLENDYQIWVNARWDKRDSLYHAEMFLAKKESDSFMNFIDSFTVSCERMSLFATIAEEVSKRYENTKFEKEICEYERLLSAISREYEAA